jgi:hypothetical protein
LTAARLLAALLLLGGCASSHTGSPAEASPGATPTNPPATPVPTTVDAPTAATTTIPPGNASTAPTTTIPAATSYPFPFPTARPGIPVGQLPGQGTVDPRITDSRLFLLGDSVMGTMRPNDTDEARKVLAPLGWRVTLDAVDGRFAAEAITVLRQRRSEIGQVVVILIGNNYGGDEKLMGQQFDTMLALLDGVPRIVFLTVEEFDAQQAEVNAELRRIAADPRVTLVDWNATVKATNGANRPDGLHLTSFGAAVLARTIADAVGPAPAPH